MNKDFAKTLEILSELAPGFAAIFLTLTSRNMPFADLKAMMDEQEAAEKRLWRKSAFKKAFTGHVTAIEIVVRNGVLEAGVHRHILVIVHPDYFSTAHALYLSQRAITAHWQSALRAPYQPIVHVSRVRGADGSTDAWSVQTVARELLKYSIKPASLFKKASDGLSANPDVVATLVKALFRRRMVRMHGVALKADKIRKQRARRAKPTSANSRS